MHEGCRGKETTSTKKILQICKAKSIPILKITSPDIEVPPFAEENVKKIFNSYEKNKKASAADDNVLQ